MLLKRDGFGNDAQTLLLLRGDAFADASPQGHTVTNSGATLTDVTGWLIPKGIATQSAQYCYVDGSPLWSFPGDFTVDWWWKTSYVEGPGILSTYGGGSGWWINQYSNGGQLRFYSLSQFDYISAITFPNNVRCHCALVRKSGVIKFAVDGGWDSGSQAYSGTINGGSGVPLNVGAVPGNPLTATSQAIRISKGARWWGRNFTPPNRMY